MGSSPVFLDPVVVPLVQGPKILDVGCGFGRWGYLCLTNYWETRVPSVVSRPEIVGCDGHLPNVEMARKNGCYAEVHHLRFPPLPFGDRSFDTVLMVEVIEHVAESEALQLIREAKRIARARVIVSTPNYPALRAGHATITGFNELEAHVSCLSRQRLRRLGFSLFGAGWRPGSRYWRGLLRRLGAVEWYDKKVRSCLSSVSIALPFAAEQIVGLWIRKTSHDE